MALRTTMATLISRVRGMINDSAGPNQTFTDDDIQDALDRYRTTVRYGLLRAEPTLTTGGVLNWSDFFSNATDWADYPETKLVGPNYAELSPTYDNLTGHWIITLANPGQTLPVWIVGNYYDVYMSAAALCEQWAMKVALLYDFFTGGQRFFRSQQRTMLLQMANQFRQHARPRYAALVRDDLDDGAQTWPLNNTIVDEW